MNSTPPTSSNISTPLTASPRFKGEVLKQIYRVWLFRKFLPVLLLEVAIFSLIMYQIAHAIFLQRVIENAMNVFFAHPSGIFSFFFSAFMSTGTVTKVLIISIAASIALLLRHLTQGVLRFILVKENYFSRVSNERSSLNKQIGG